MGISNSLKIAWNKGMKKDEASASSFGGGGGIETASPIVN